MTRRKINMKRINENGKGWKFFLFIICCLSIGLIAFLRADTSARASFSIELKEWLVLEIKSGSDGFSDTGNEQALGQTEILCGQPLQVRVLLSMSEGKTVALKGIIYKEGEGRFDRSVLVWRGQGDLQGEGRVLTGQESVFAVWQGSGLKTGSLVFLDPENIQSQRYKALFTLSAI